MTRISAEDVAVLATPTWQDARRGAFATWVYISFGVPLCLAAWMMAGTSSVLSGLGFAIIVALIAFLFITTISGAVILIFGIAAGMLLSKALSRVTRWQLHLAAYFALGTLAYGLVLLPVRLLDPSESGFFIYFFSLGPATPLLIGACVAAGWATAWRHAVKRAAAPPTGGQLETLLAD